MVSMGVQHSALELSTEVFRKTSIVKECSTGVFKEIVMRERVVQNRPKVVEEWTLASAAS